MLDYSVFYQSLRETRVRDELGWQLLRTPYRAPHGFEYSSVVYDSISFEVFVVIELSPQVFRLGYWEELYSELVYGVVTTEILQVYS